MMEAKKPNTPAALEAPSKDLATAVIEMEKQMRATVTQGRTSIMGQHKLCHVSFRCMASIKWK